MNPRTNATTLLLAVCLLLAACVGDVKLRAGHEVDVEKVQQLRIGQSTSGDVQRLFGKPYGKGRSYLPYQGKKVDVWTYYYELATLSDSRRTFLFVYLDRGRYDGHMWFSSLPEEHR
ncbi:MAG: hypothetical protein ACYS0E_07875 [Planctomycetota bacterium]|jgi:hypothetical protein